VTETGGKQFSIGVENEFRKDQLFRGVIERLKENLIKKGAGENFITIVRPSLLILRNK